MNRGRLLLSAGLILGFVALILSALLFAVTRVPYFCKEAQMAEGVERKALSTEAFGSWLRARAALASLEPDWKVRFSEKQLNAYFQQDYLDHGGDANLPEGFSSPRVKIENGKIRVAVREKVFGAMSVCYSLEMKVWLVPDKSNVVALEIVSLKAGAIPLSTSALLDYISQVARHQNTDVTWYRSDGHPVAVMRFQSDLTRPTLQFDRIEIENGVITVAGRSMSPYAAQRK